MKRIHLPELPWVEQKSPRGNFHSHCQNISLALGGIRNGGVWSGGHPFDLQIRRIPPGASICPYHSHLAQWELFLVRAGAGTVRASGESYPIKTGDVFIHPPGDAHQLINTGPLDLEVLIVADNPLIDGCFYPDSNKWSLRPAGKYFRMTEVDYFDGEEEPLAGAPAYQPAGSPPAPPITPFPQRKLHPDSLSWEPWQSPKGKFRAASKELSIALGAVRNAPTGLGGHPFDLELGRLAPGMSGCPFHSHSHQWELYVILSGTGTVRADAETGTVVAGDVVMHPPGEAHQLTNSGADDLDYYLVADNPPPPSDICHYPDSNKWGFRAPRKIFRATDIDYHDGEE
jgi:uncharacterized cupin superfamily protein